jgi:hypothetical protein
VVVGSAGARRRARHIGETGMGSIIAGVVLIGIGLVGGGSVFYGEFTVWSVLVDGLGIFWIGKGIRDVMKGRAEA